jgi:hypothetical protein
VPPRIPRAERPTRGRSSVGRASASQADSAPNSLCPTTEYSAAVAQLVERELPKLEVAGSRPVRRLGEVTRQWEIAAKHTAAGSYTVEGHRRATRSRIVLHVLAGGSRSHRGPIGFQHRLLLRSPTRDPRGRPWGVLLVVKRRHRPLSPPCGEEQSRERLARETCPCVSSGTGPRRYRDVLVSRPSLRRITGRGLRDTSLSRRRRPHRLQGCCP